jgi:hypothetical protein
MNIGRLVRGRRAARDLTEDMDYLQEQVSPHGPVNALTPTFEGRATLKGERLKVARALPDGDRQPATLSDPSHSPQSSRSLISRLLCEIQPAVR